MPAVPRSLRPRSQFLQAFLVLFISSAGIRRWLLLGAAGGVLFGVGSAYLFRFFSNAPMPHFLPGVWEAVLFIGLAGLAIIVATWRLYLRLGPAIATTRPDETLRSSVIRYYQQARGPKVVAIGGGTGLSTLLRGIKDQTAQVTGIVTVGDDGGSSGRLRKDLGVLPPGDFRNCIVALAEAEPLMKQLFQYRFGAGAGLDGHSFGNLFIVAMSEVTGSFEDAIAESSRVLKVTGRILPSTLDNVQLGARMTDGSSVRGESQITAARKRIDRLFMTPSKPQAYRQAVEALGQAQLIVIGPGSLYTSILPNLLVPGIAEAINASPAPVVYVSNMATQPGETDGYSVADHFAALRKHSPSLRIDYVLVNTEIKPLGPDSAESALIEDGVTDIPGVEVCQADLMNDDFRTHHDPQKLAAALMRLYDRSTRHNGRRGATPAKEIIPA